MHALHNKRLILLMKPVYNLFEMLLHFIALLFITEKRSHLFWLSFLGRDVGARLVGWGEENWAFFLRDEVAHDVSDRVCWEDGGDAESRAEEGG